MKQFIYQYQNNIKYITMNDKKVIKPDIEKNLETNGSGGIGSGSGVSNEDIAKSKFKIPKSAIIIIGIIAVFILALIIF